MVSDLLAASGLQVQAIGRRNCLAMATYPGIVHREHDLRVGVPQVSVRQAGGHQVGAHRLRYTYLRMGVAIGDVILIGIGVGKRTTSTGGRGLRYR